MQPRTSGAIGPDQVPVGLRRLVGQGKLARERVVVSGTHYVVVGGALRDPGAVLLLLQRAAGVERSRRLAQCACRRLVGAGGACRTGRNAVARRTLAPVAQASNAARSLAEGLLDTRLPVAGDDEFGAWAAAFNDMAAALEAKIGALAEAQERERRFTANVAHDLRSPLTALIGEARQLAKQAQDLPPEFQQVTGMLVADVDRLCRLTRGSA